MTKCRYCLKEVKPDAQKCEHCGGLLQGINLTDKKQKVNQTLGRNKKIGILWLVGPIVGLILVLITYAFVRFMFPGASVDSTLHQVTNVILGLFGIIFTILEMIGIPVGIVYLNKKEYVNTEFDPRSGKGKESSVPAEIKGWSWGAFEFSWIWGLVHSVYISLLVFIPYFNLVWVFILGAKGKKWAWQSRPWPSVEEFNRVQKKWDFWGKILFGIQMTVVVLVLALIVFTWSDEEQTLSPFYSGYDIGYQEAMDKSQFCASCNFPEPVAEFQEGYYYGYYDACVYEKIGCETNLPQDILQEIIDNYAAESRVVS